MSRKRKKRTKKYFSNNTKKSRTKKTKHPYIDTSNPIILEERVFPIYGCDASGKTLVVRGTCFPLCNGYFMTASHVLDGDQNYPKFKMGFLNQISSGCVELYEFEICEQFIESDIAIIKCKDIYTKEKKPKSSPWITSKLKHFETVRAMGYPFGYDSTKKYTTARSFQGTKVGRMYYDIFGIKAEFYELSFQCLRGLSGACLFDEYYNIHGVISRNTKDELEIFRETEEIKKSDGSVNETVIRNETRFIGLAVTSKQIFNLNSKTFGMNVHDYLIQEKMH